MVIWDRGTFEPVEQTADKISFILRGEKLKGEFALTRLKSSKGKGNEWLLIKKKDEFALSQWKLEKCLTPEKRGLLKERMPPCKAS